MIPRPFNQRRETFAADVVSAAGILDSEVEEALFKAFASVDRADFFPGEFRPYSGRGGNGDSCSELERPSVVARMLSLLPLHKGARIFEIGTRLGYSAALLATAGVQVFSSEKVLSRAQETRKRLDERGCSSVLVLPGEGRDGWPEHAPYDGILFSTVVEEVSFDLAAQLAADGRIVVPLAVEAGVRLTLFDSELRMTPLERLYGV